MKITEIEFSVRAEHALKNAGIKTLEQLFAYDWRKFASQPQTGVMTMAEIGMKVMEICSGEMAGYIERSIWLHNKLKRLEKITHIINHIKTITEEK